MAPHPGQFLSLIWTLRPLYRIRFMSYGFIGVLLMISGLFAEVEVAIRSPWIEMLKNKSWCYAGWMPAIQW